MSRLLKAIRSPSPFAPNLCSLGIATPSRKIAQVRIDSYNNRDQNKVGYSVLLSDDGQAWRQVFYAKRYPPSSDGFTDLFFEPQFTRFIKLEQKGGHQFANWVIHELNVYEAIN